MLLAGWRGAGLGLGGGVQLGAPAENRDAPLQPEPLRRALA